MSIVDTIKLLDGFLDGLSLSVRAITAYLLVVGGLWYVERYQRHAQDDGALDRSPQN